jgi:protocatechuate 3,4-dioxygenase beta subunit
VPKEFPDNQAPTSNRRIAHTTSDVSLDKVDDSLVTLMDALEDIDENKPSAKLNEISMIDNKGRRIYY